jgi:hypothetical protein
VGDFENGNIYAFNLEDYSDNGQIQKWLRSWRALPTGQNNLKRTAQHSLQLDCEAGVAIEYPSPTALDPDAAYFSATTVESTATSPVTTGAGDYLVFSMSSIPAPASTQGVDPEVMLRWSDDGGHTWSNEHWSKLGKIGEYYRRVFWRRLGMTLKLRDRVYELSGTDPVKIAIMGAELIISPTNA